MLMPTFAVIVQNAVDYRYLGVATSSGQFFRMIGSVFGLAVFASILASSYESEFNSRLPAQTRDTVVGPTSPNLDHKGECLRRSR